jgi:hypothetical protein
VEPHSGSSAEEAALAIRRFAAFLRDEVAGARSAADVVPLGEDEVDRRLEAWWLVGGGRATIAARARDELASARDDVVSLAGRLAPRIEGTPSRISTFGDAKLVLDRLLEARAASDEAVLAQYAAAIERATAFCREHKTFSVPAACVCEVRRAPPLWRRFAACTNWPAPLLAGDAPGACAVVPDASLHPLLNVPSLAIHEAIPGHSLQSRAWQLRFGSARAPVRFLGVPDECGLLRDAWIPHLMIEAGPSTPRCAWTRPGSTTRPAGSSRRSAG